MGLYLNIVSMLEHRNIKIDHMNPSWSGSLWNTWNKITDFVIYTKYIHSVWNRFRFRCHRYISQYITVWPLAGKMVCYLDFTFQILIFPYCYHGNKWRIKAAGNKKPLLHNWVWPFLHRHKRAFTTRHCYSTTSLRVPQGRDRVRLCLCAALGKWLGERLPSGFKAMGLCSHSTSAVSHTAEANISLTSVSATRWRGYLLFVWFPLPTTPFTGQPCGNK